MDYKTAPGPKPSLLLGNASDFWRDGPLTTLIRYFDEHGDFLRMKLGKQDGFLINDPDDVQRVLQKNAKNYSKADQYEGLRLVLGDGLVTSNGEFWRRQRKLAQPAFAKPSITSFANSMVTSTQEMLDGWNGSQIDLHQEMMTITLQIVTRTLFGKNLDKDIEEIKRIVPIVLDFAAYWIRYPFHVPQWLPTKRNREFREAMGSLEKLIYTEITDRSEEVKEGTILDLFMAAVDEDSDAKMTVKQLRDEVVTMIGAGHETTASTLTFVWLLLTKHPEVLKKLQAEVDEVLGDKPPTLEAIKKLEYTERVLQETMRLYPPVWSVPRRAIGPDKLSGYDIPPGAEVFVCIYTLHRNPRLWDEPDTFDPDRFLPERVEKRHRFAYIPFLGGPRICIGKHFAMLEAKIVLAMIAQRFELQAEVGSEKLSDKITLRLQDGLNAKIRPRRNHPARAAS